MKKERISLRRFKGKENLIITLLEMGIKGGIIFYIVSIIDGQYFPLEPNQLQVILNAYPEQVVLSFDGSCITPHPAVSKGYLSSGKAQNINFLDLWAFEQQIIDLNLEANESSNNTLLTITGALLHI